MRLELIVAGFPAAEVLRAPALVLTAPISFWGGVSPGDGRLLDSHYAGQERFIGGTALFIRELRGSSSASSVLLELIYRRAAPAAIIVDTPDAILALGAIVGREMGWPTPPILRLPANEQASIPDGAHVLITGDGLSFTAGDR
jgi:predicted aconitase with swiveling domain